MMIGAAIGAAGFALLLRLGASTTYPTMLLPFLLIPTGIGLAVPAMTTAVLAAVDKKWSGTASALLNTARQAGGAIGVAVFGALVGGGRDTIVGGLHAASAASAALLLVAAALAWKSIATRETSNEAVARAATANDYRRHNDGRSTTAGL